MANVTEFLNQIDEFVLTRAQNLTWSRNFLERVESKTGISVQRIVQGFNRAVLLIFMLAYGPMLLLNALVVFYPAYQSFEALEFGNIDSATKWIKYWMVFGIFQAMENMTNCLIWSLPEYLFFKVVFFLWCLAPSEYNGSVVIYEKYIRPTFLRNGETVDKFLTSVRRFIYRSSEQ